MKDEAKVILELQAWLGFLSTFLWQLIVIAVVLLFRSELRALLRKLAKLKVGETELTFQQSEPGAVPLPKEEILRKAVALVGEGGFLSSEGIRQVVLAGSPEAESDTVTGMLRIFETPRQHTWLVATTREVVCVLDDEKTRASGRLVQWRMALERAVPISAKRGEGLSSLLSVGERKNWLYSRDLFSSPEELEQQVKRLVGQR
jgi:hypothetical protein